MTLSQASAPTTSDTDARLQRRLKIAIAIMTTLIFAGLLAMVTRLVYLGSQPPTQAASPAGTRSIPADLTFALPAGAEIRNLSLSGDRVAVHFVSPSGAGIAILDLSTGKVSSMIDVKTEASTR